MIKEIMAMFTLRPQLKGSEPGREDPEKRFSPEFEALLEKYKKDGGL
jgi:hypothetical protein